MIRLPIILTAFALLNAQLIEAVADDLSAEQLVPGFSLEDEFSPVPGFGEDDDYVSVQVLEQDRSTAADRFRRYDSNQDGFLSREELARNRWDDDPLTFDRDRDGRLSRAEMASRYAQRRVDKQQAEVDRLMKFYVALDTNGNKILEPSEYAKNRARSEIERRIREAGMDPARPIALRMFMSKRLGKAGVTSEQTKKVVKSFGASTRAESELQKAEADRLMKFYIALDRNRNRVLEPAEYAKHPYRSTIERRIREVGMDPARPIALSAFMSKRLGKEGVKSNQVRTMVKSLSSTRNRSKRSDRSKSNSQAYRIKTAHERLPSDIPDWFRDKDLNLDGQVQLSEYSANWTDARIAEFRGFDLNSDGVLTAQECIASRANESAE